MRAIIFRGVAVGLGSFRSFFIAHRWVLAGAALLALLIILPSFIFPFLSGNSYRGVDIGNWDDYANYLTKGREIIEGHQLGNLFLNIGKDASSDPHQVYRHHTPKSDSNVVYLRNEKS